MEKILRLINNKEENIFVDFKENFHFFQENGKSNNEVFQEFYKDCIGFLNAPERGDKYLIFGIKELEGNDFEIVGVNDEDLNLFKEERFQDQINNYITPVPIIHVKTIPIDDKKVVAIEISKTNQLGLYSLNKSMTLNKTTYVSGDSWIRKGSRVKKLSPKEAVEISQNSSSLLSLVDADLIHDLSRIDEIIDFVHFMDTHIVNASDILEFIHSDISLLKKFNEVFTTIVLAGKFLEILEVEEIDGGSLSLINGIFFISKEIYDISKYFELNLWNGQLTLKNKESNNLTRAMFHEFSSRVEKINDLINSYISLQYKYSGIYFYKLTDIIFDEETLNIYGESELKFQISENILSLFLEPLYASRNPFVVTIRELLQNSFDAVNHNKNAEIRVEFNYKNDKLTEVSIYDNGVGMNWDDITNYYLKVGNSSKKAGSIGYIGQFGIGGLSLFMISNSCRITTKKAQNEICCFSIQKEEFIVRKETIKVISELQSTPSFTKIDLTISDEFSGYTKEQIISLLNLNETFVQYPVELSFCFEEEVFEAKLIDINNIHRELFDIFEFKGSEIFVLKNRQYIELSDSEIRASPYDSLQKLNNRILYNNQLGNIRIEDDFPYRNLSKEYLPFIIVSGKISATDGYITELSREKYTLKGQFLNELVENLYKFNIPRFVDGLNDINKTEISVDEKLNKSNRLLQRLYLNFNGLLINNNKIMVLKSNTIQNVRKIYSNDLSGSQLKKLLSDNKNIMLESMNSDKSIIAKRISTASPIVISNNLLQRYIVRAQGYNAGFKNEALQTFLTLLGIPFKVSNKVTEIWDDINTKDELIMDILKRKTRNTLTYLNDEGERIVNNVEESYPNILIVDTKITMKNDNKFDLFMEVCNDVPWVDSN